MMTGAGAGPLQTAGNDTPGASAGNQAVTTAGNEPTQTPAAAAGNQATGPLSTNWNGSTEPNASAIAQLPPRENDSHPYPLVDDNQPTDPDGDGLYEDVNGDGAVNIVDVDALSRHLGSTAVGANWSAYDYTGDNRTDVGDIQWLLVATRSTASNDTDGDGLPDAYERNVTKTDPRVADSDGDAVIDGAEDWDNDTLPAYREYRLGTDPHSNDTDGDGLTDEVESRLQGVDPTDPDTNGDGVSDSEWNLDQDNLTTGEELEAGTDPFVADSDSDGFTDGREIEHGTNALNPDTDDDGLLDGEEITLGTDPTNPDSDSDGVRDGNETFTTTTADEDLGLTVRVNGSGDIASSVSTSGVTDGPVVTDSLQNASVSPVVEFESEREFDNATIAFSYNESAVPNNESTLAIFRYNRSAQTYVPLNTTVDAENNTVRTQTPHFSRYVAMDYTEWVKQFDGNRTSPWSVDQNFTNTTIANLPSWTQTQGMAVQAGVTNGSLQVTSPGDDSTTGLKSIDTFEDGDLSEYYLREGSSDHVRVTDSPQVTPRNGSNLLEVASGVKLQSRSGLDRYPSAGDTFDFWVHFNGVEYGQERDLGFRFGVTDEADHFYNAYLGQGDSPIQLRREHGSSKYVFAETDTQLPKDRWLRGRIEWGKDGQISLTVTDTQGNQYANISGVDTTLKSGGIEYHVSDNRDDPSYFGESVIINSSAVSPDDGSSTETSEHGQVTRTFGSINGIKNFTVQINATSTGGGRVALQTANGSVLDNASITKRDVYRLNASGTETNGRLELAVTAENGIVSVDRVRVKRDSDGDGLPDTVERAETRIGSGETIQTDPTDADTDGDGLSDSKEIGQYTEVRYRGTTVSYYKHLANPRQVDTDGDNLTDAEEVAGWEVQRTTSANASQGYLNVSRPDPSKQLLRSYLRSLYRGETDAYQHPINRGTDSRSSRAIAIAIAKETDINVSVLSEAGNSPSPNRAYLTNTTAISDPLLSDTDDDGLADNVEHLRGTDPNRADTDGDSIPDQTEFESGTAPVLFDHRAPTVTIEGIRTKRIKDSTKVVVRQQGTTKTVSPKNIDVTDSDGPNSIFVAKYRYTVRLRAHDPSGVSKLVVKPDCQYLARQAGSNLDPVPQSACQVDGETIEFDNETTTSYRRVEFTVRTPVDKAGVFALQELGQFFETSPVTVTAIDSNRNRRSSDYTSPGAIPELAKTAADHPATGEVTEDRVISGIAYRSGGVWGIQQSALDISYFLSHPWTAVTWLGDLEKLPDAALRAPETLPSAARNLQDRQNPFDRSTETENYKLYGQSWLVGYGTGTAGSEVSIGLATGGGSTVSKAAKLRKVTDTVGDAGTTARGWTFHRSVKMASTISKDTDIKPAGTRRALGRVAIPERVRHAQRLNSPRWTRLIESVPERATGPSRTERVSRSMRRTGDSGRELMLDLHSSGDQRALETFVAMDDVPATQRAFARAYESGDLGSDEMATALKRYDELDSREQDAADELIADTGDDGTEFLAEADDNTVQRVVADGGIDGYDRTKADLLADDSVDSAMITRVDDRINKLNTKDAERAKDLVDETGADGARIIDELGKAKGDALQSFIQADLQGADMAKWRNGLARKSGDSDSPVQSEGIAQYAKDVRGIQKLKGSDNIDIKNSEGLVEETIEDPTASQIRGQKFEASRTKYYAEEYGDVTVEPATSGQGEPDLLVNRGSSSKPLYVEQKNVKGDLKGGLELKDRIHKADGSFDGISKDHNRVVEIGAEGKIPDDFNPTTTGTDTPKESFKELIRAKRNGEDINRLPKSLSGWDNPGMTVKIINDNGEAVDNGKFSVRKAYNEVNNGN
ncbi:hypothetical protein AMS69_13805 [Haloarcula rubripromontorii]|uniref:Uncharacterized protein n=2 Tax=Haloarcula rubripromontorii TaxID=1705562 RepID=A0A0M9AJ06_9EURY|nr:hypothetical protein AMS69_13805 [Haloarcula rubripromontorii]